MKYVQVNKALMVVTSDGQHTPKYTRVEPNIFEAVKAFCIVEASGSLAKHLPYICIHIPPDLPDLALWKQAFTDDNSPQKISFRGRGKDLFELIKDIDFQSPYDETKACDVRYHFRVCNKKESTIDADLIAQGELDDTQT